MSYTLEQYLSFEGLEWRFSKSLNFNKTKSNLKYVPCLRNAC